MTQDAYWDELGLAWTAINPEIMAPRLKARLRRQTILGRLTVFGGLPLCMAGAVLGAWTLWRGATLEAWFFVTRGLAIITLSLLGGFAAWSFHAAGTDKSDSLAAMVALALRRAQARLVAIRLGLVGLGTTALLGSLGYVLRSQMGKPSAMPLAAGVVVLALLALVLALLDARARTEVAKLRVLQNLLAEEPR
jgi:hypothetical protein